MGHYELKKSQKKSGLSGLASMSQTLMGGSQEYYFVLVGSNGETIAQSEMYSSKQAAQNGIKSCQTNGSTTDVRDQTK